jgi:5-methyltetrahydrofolate--homocysteine methyltransferase
LLSLSEALQNGLKINWDEYQPLKPAHQEKQIMDVPIMTLLPFIDWRFFFKAWRLPGNYPDIASIDRCIACETGWLNSYPPEEQGKAKEALKLFHDAQDVLALLHEKGIAAKTVVDFFEANATDEKDALIIYTNDQKVSIPVLRQQTLKTDGQPNLSLADFILPEHVGKRDYIGAFSTTIAGTETLSKEFAEKGDDYTALLIQSLSDRLAEAAAEYLHQYIRQHAWGYAPEEALSQTELLKERYQGIRPAVGYPSLPDLSIIFELDPLLHLSDIGIQLTENGAMIPNASVSGLVFAHPQARYFMIGKIGQDQREKYAARRKMTLTELRKWLPE